MREIKFRAWDKKREVMECEVIVSPFWVRDYDRRLMRSEDVVVMQYTGLKDRKGVEIYEGDIIRWHDIVTADCPITFTNGVFCLDNRADENFYHHRHEISNKWEVIGNIYENNHT